MTVAPDDPRHGTLAFFAVGRDERGRRVRCHCGPCELARLRYDKRRTMKLDAGQPLTVPNVGFTRRVQALAAFGYPREYLARELGIAGRALSSKVVPGGRIRIATHQRMVDIFDRLSMTPGPSSISRARSLARGWVPPLAWDDDTIDDPDGQPYRPRTRRDHDDDPLTTAGAERQLVDHVVVERALAGDLVKANARERAEIRRRWTRAGGSLRTLNVRQGWNLERDRRDRAVDDESEAA